MIKIKLLLSIISLYSKNYQLFLGARNYNDYI